MNNKNNQNERDEPREVPDDVVKGIFEREDQSRQESDILGQELSKVVPIKSPKDQKNVKKEITERPAKHVATPIFSRSWGRSAYLGIDIGSHSIKVVQLSKAGHKVQIDKMVIAELPSEVIESEHRRIEYLQRILKNVLKKNKLRGKGFSVIPNELVTIKNVSLPRMPVGDIAGAIEWQIKQEMEENEKDIVIDYILFNENGKSNNDTIQALTASSKRQDIIDHIDLLSSIGIKCLAIEPNAFSLIASLDYNGRVEKDKVALVIDFGGYESSLCVVRNKEINFVRKLDVNSYSFISAIKESLNVPFEAAEQIIKNNYSSVNDSGSEKDERNRAMIISALVFQLEKLVSDIEHTFKYYSFRLTKSEETEFHKIILCGGLANLELLQDFLQERFNVPVETDDPVRNIVVKKGVMTDEHETDKSALRFSVAIGSALRMLG